VSIVQTPPKAEPQKVKIVKEEVVDDENMRRLEMLEYPEIKSPYYEISHESMKTLKPTCWLNDEIINAFMILC
jgi:Ulp1 family protease